MLADLERLADTCPQRSLITFLRAAAILSEIPRALPTLGLECTPEPSEKPSKTWYRPPTR